MEPESQNIGQVAPHSNEILPLPTRAPGWRNSARPLYAEILSDSPVSRDEASSGISESVYTLYKNKGKLILLSLLGGCLGYLYVLPQTPVYRASTSLEVLDVNNSFLNMKNLEPTLQENSLETRLNTEMRMIQSASLVRQVAANLQQSDLPRTKMEPDRLTTLVRNLGLPPLRQPPTRRNAIQMAAASLKVRNPDLTRIVEISCESTDPTIAAAFANALTQTYMEQSVEGRLQNAQRTRDWLDNQIEEVRVKLEKASAHLVEYSQASGLTLGSEATDKLKKLQEQLSDAQAAVVQKSTEYQIAKENAANLPEFQADENIRTLNQRLIAKTNELSELKTALSPAHYRVKRLEAQRADLVDRIKEEQGKVLERVGAELARAKLRERLQAEAYAEQSGIVTDQSRKMIRHSMLRGEVETYRQLYDSMLQRVKEGAIASAMRASNVRVVDKAEVPKSPYHPEPVRTVLAGFSTGLSLAVVIVFLRNSSDAHLRNPGDASTYLHIRELGSIPSARQPGTSSIKRLFSQEKDTPIDLAPPNEDSDVEAKTNTKDSVELITWARNPSPQADSFRSVLVSLLSGSGDQKSIVVTSPNPGDGKSSVVSNLGIALTEMGRKVLMIDADLRRPRLHQVFNIPNACGLSDLIAGEMPIDRYPLEALGKPTLVPQLYLLPSGPGARNIARVLYSRRTRDLLARLQEEFDVILIDTPPMLHYPDARILARSAGGAVLVLRAGRTARESGKRAVERLADDGVYIFGAVLNDWNAKASGTYGRDYMRSYDPA